MFRVTIALAVLTVPARPPDAAAQDSLKLDPSIAHVVTGGSWTSAGASGQYRIIVRTGGWEHVVSELYIQWLEENSQTQRVVVRTTQLVKAVPPGIYSLGAPDLTCIDTGCRFRISGTNSSTLQKASWVIKLGPPGEYAVITM